MYACPFGPAVHHTRLETVKRDRDYPASLRNGRLDFIYLLVFKISCLISLITGNSLIRYLNYYFEKENMRKKCKLLIGFET